MQGVEKKKTDNSILSFLSMGFLIVLTGSKKGGREMEKEGCAWTVCAGCGERSKAVGQDKDGEEPAAIHHDG